MTDKNFYNNISDEIAPSRKVTIFMNGSHCFNSFLKGLTSLIVGGRIGAEFRGLLSISLSSKELPDNLTIGVKSGCPVESCGVENDLRDQPVLLGSGSLFLCQNVFGKFSR